MLCFVKKLSYINEIALTELHYIKGTVLSCCINRIVLHYINGIFLCYVKGITLKKLLC